jgi:hypothetical protein
MVNFSNVEESLKMKLNLTQNFTAIVTRHGKTKEYLHRFKIMEDPTCTCEKAVKTTDHLIFECETLSKERNNPEDNRPTKRQMTNEQKIFNKETL